MTIDDITAAIGEVTRELNDAQSRFEMQTDTDLIEASIYEMESLRARYRYFLKLARAGTDTGAAVAPATRVETAG
ncbi:MAG: YaaL family protein [Oscillospiraceae bacterium]|nr:YaaL family protein [Oscillospiraceae bacterium]